MVGESEDFDVFDVSEALDDIPELPEVSDDPEDPADPDEPGVDDLAGVAGVAADDSVALEGGVAAAEESVALEGVLLPAAAGAFDDPEDCGVEGDAWFAGGVALLLDVVDSSRCLQANRAGKTRRAKI